MPTPYLNHSDHGFSPAGRSHQLSARLPVTLTFTSPMQKEKSVLKKAMMSVSLTVVAAVSILIPCIAASPVKLNKVAPVADLVAEAEAKIKALETALATSDSYGAGAKRAIPDDAAVLAVLSQAIAEHEEKAAWKASAPDLREAAKALANSTSYDAAKKAFADAKAAHGGKAGSAKKDDDWAKLAKLGSVMNEVNKRNSSIRTGLRKADSDSEQLARSASVLAVLALVTHEDTHEVKKKEDTPKWKALAADMQASMSGVAASLKKKDTAAAKDAFSKAGKSCNDCHDQFRDN